MKEARSPTRSTTRSTTRSPARSPTRNVLGAGSRGHSLAGGGGRRRLRYEDALGSARETFAGLEAAAAVGYIEPVSAALSSRFDHIIGVLVRVIART